jgi:hypothetical protein
MLIVDRLDELGLGEVEVARINFGTVTFLCTMALSNAKDRLVGDRMFVIGRTGKRSDAAGGS